LRNFIRVKLFDRISFSPADRFHWYPKPFPNRNQNIRPQVENPNPRAGGATTICSIEKLLTKAVIDDVAAAQPLFENQIAPLTGGN